MTNSGVSTHVPPLRRDSRPASMIPFASSVRSMGNCALREHEFFKHLHHETPVRVCVQRDIETACVDGSRIVARAATR